MKSSSKINLRDVLWWMSIRDAYRLEVPITTRLSKKWCISLTARGKSSCPTCSMTKTSLNPFNLKKYSSKMGLSKIQNLKHKYRTTKAQLPKNSIDKNLLGEHLCLVALILDTYFLELHGTYRGLI
jgi:hypothetical protein